jgi:hypothetical protein
MVAALNADHSEQGCALNVDVSHWNRSVLAAFQRRVDSTGNVPSVGIRALTCPWRFSGCGVLNLRTTALAAARAINAVRKVQSFYARSGAKAADGG